MIWLFYIALFLISCVILYLSGKWVVDVLMRIAKFLSWSEFVVAFFVMAVASSLPNLFVGITAASQGISELSFGDVLGNNLVALTLAVALAVLFSPNKEISSESKVIQTTALYTLTVAVLPIILVLDKTLSRIDGILLILVFVFYMRWLFSKKERFSRIYNQSITPLKISIGPFLKDLTRTVLGIALLLLAAYGITRSAVFFAEELGLSLLFIGLLIIGLGNALPETYFAVASAKKNQTFMILGDLMGAVIIPATLVLGIVALISPIKISNLETAAISRVFLIISALLFYFFARSDKKITKREGYFLLLIYILFITSAVLYNL